jgi:hypothetical protein
MDYESFWINYDGLYHSKPQEARKGTRIIRNFRVDPAQGKSWKLLILWCIFFSGNHLSGITIMILMPRIPKYLDKPALFSY